MPGRKPQHKRPSLAESLKRKRSSLGAHGTRAWNAEEMRRFGSAEVYYYRISGKKALAGLKNRKITTRFLNSVRGNTSYWAKKHLLDWKEFVERADPADMPTIVFVKHPEDALPDEQFFSAQERARPFDPYSADIEPKHVAGVLRLQVPELKSIAGNLRKQGRLDRRNLVSEITKAMQRKAVAFIRGKKR